MNRECLGYLIIARLALQPASKNFPRRSDDTKSNYNGPVAYLLTNRSLENENFLRGSHMCCIPQPQCGIPFNDLALFHRPRCGRLHCEPLCFVLRDCLISYRRPTRVPVFNRSSIVPLRDKVLFVTRR